MTYIDKAKSRIVVTGTSTAASVHRAAAQSIPSGVSTPVVFDTSDISSDVSATFTAPSTGVTIRYSGVYRLSFRASIIPSAAAANTRLVVQIFVNGLEVTRTGGPLAGTATVSYGCTALLLLSADDVVSANIFQDTGAAQNTITTQNTWPALDVEYLP